jgi:hypothetical protein
MTCVLPGDLAVFTVAGGSPWDPTTAVGSGGLIFSNSNRTVTGATPLASGSCKGKRNRGTSGRYYFEIKANVVTTSGIDNESAGLVDSAWVGGFGCIGSDADSVGIVAAPSATAYVVLTNSGGIGSFSAAPTNGDVFGFAVDGTGVDTEIWFSLNGLWLGTGTTTFPTGSPDLTWGAVASSALWPGTTNDSTSTHTLNTGQQTFAHTPPAGFVAWG